MVDQFLSSIEINYNYWILQSIAMLITCFAIQGLSLTHPLGALFAVIGLAFVNSVLWDAALFFSIPDRVTLQAAVVLLANSLIFWLIIKLLPGIEIRGILPAIVAPLIFSFTSVGLERWGSGLDLWELAKDGVNWLAGVRNSLVSGSGGHGISSFSQ